MKRIDEIRPEIARIEPHFEPTGELHLYKVAHRQPQLPDPFVRWLGTKNDRPLYRLEKADCVIPDLRTGRRVIVEEGFEFDAASVPRIVWTWMSPQDLGVLSVLSHDWIYAQGGEVLPFPYTRHEADILFHDLMVLEDVTPARRGPAYRAVRLFGRFAWQQPPQQEAA